MSKTTLKKFGIGFQVQRFHYRDEKRNLGFASAYAPITIGYKKGKFTFLLKRPTHNRKTKQL